MKIIQDGIIPENIPRRTSCDKCKCVFEYTIAEVEYISDQRDGDCYKLNCPFCQKTLYISVRIHNYSGGQYDR